MIFDNLKNCEQYFGLHPLYKKAFAFLKEASENFPATGKHEIDGDRLFASVQAYDTLTEDGKMEAHENYIDIQLVVSGKETMYVKDITKAELTDAYREDWDAAFYKVDETCSKLCLTPGDFVVLLPNDAHRPCVAFEGTSEAVQKVVMKVKL
ncbi:MAG: YhcH/YjgK/YiaL family protein [Clostridia bacterium]|nr:YhcH/YjgK/YiaL family protein [Clostridia bacterium]